MEAVTFFIAVVALVVAVIAFKRTGGIKNLRDQVEAAGSKTETMRDRTADVLERLERLVRGKEKSAPEQAEKQEPGKSSEPE